MHILIKTSAPACFFTVNETCSGYDFAVVFTLALTEVTALAPGRLSKLL